MVTRTALNHSAGRASYGAAASAEALLNVVYRSRAVQPLAAPELHGLVAAAQARNHGESISGVVLYDDSRFLQWLEGPASSLDRVMRSINADGRHTDIHVLTSRPVGTRAFRGWDMQLAVSEADRQRPGLRTVRLDGATLDQLRTQPESAVELLPKIIRPSLAESLRDVVLERVIPELARARRPAPVQQIEELAGLLLAGRTETARELLAGARRTARFPELVRGLIEPALRHMGDLWCDDRCSMTALTLAVCELRTMVRFLASPSLVPTPSVPARTVLVAAQPGELHSMASVLDGEMLWRLGWQTRVEFPSSDAELGRMLGSGHVDCLVLGLSGAIGTVQERAVVAQTVAAGRRACRNPALAVVVSGRAPAEDQDFAGSVGADAGASTAAEIGRVVGAALRGAPQGSVLH